jgi:AcrR family transcriptional regulator
LLRETPTQVTTQDVAQVAGVSVGSLYRYFPTKDSLLHAWLAKLVERRTQRLRLLIEGSAERELSSVLRELIDAAISTRREQGVAEDLLMSLFLRYNATDILKAQDAVLVPSFSRMLREHAHETRPLDPDLSAYVLVHALRAVLVAAAHEPGLLDSALMREELVQLAVSHVAR